MTLDRQPAAAAERRPLARTITTIRPMRTMTPSRTHSQIRPEPDPLPAAGDLLGGAITAAVGALLVAGGCPVDGASALGLALGWAVTLALGWAVTLALRL